MAVRCSALIRRDDPGLPLGPAEDPQRRQAGDDVEEVVRQPGEQPELAPVRGLGVQADEGHEHRDERQGDGDRAGGDEIRRRDAGQDDDRHQCREHELRQVPREVGVQCVEAPGGQGGDRAAVTRRARSQRRDVGEEPGPQLVLHRGRRTGPRSTSCAQATDARSATTAASQRQRRCDSVHVRRRAGRPR